MTASELIEWVETIDNPDPDEILKELCKSLYLGEITEPWDLRDVGEYVLEFCADETPESMGWPPL